MEEKNIEKLLINILNKKKNEDQKKRFIKLLIQGINNKEDRKKEIIIHGLYNLEFQL